MLSELALNHRLQFLYQIYRPHLKTKRIFQPSFTGVLVNLHLLRSISFISVRFFCHHASKLVKEKSFINQIEDSRLEDTVQKNYSGNRT